MMLHLLAVLVPLFVAAPWPGGCTRYAVIRDAGAGWAHVASTPAAGAPHALPDTVLAEYPGGRYAFATYRLGCICGSDTAWTAQLLVADAVAWPDTNAFVESTGGMRAVKVPGRWPLAETERGVVVTHQETVQRRLSRRIVELFGYWVGARGERSTEVVE